MTAGSTGGTAGPPTGVPGLRYWPGQCGLVARAGYAALVPQAGADLIDRLWALGERGRPAARDALAALGSHDLATLPAFGLLVWDDTRTLVFLRGDVAATLVGPGGSRAWDGVDTETWVERRLDPAAARGIGLGTPGTGAGLPLTDAAVLAAGLVLAPAGTSQTAAPDAPRSARFPVSATWHQLGSAAAPAATAAPAWSRPAPDPVRPPTAVPPPTGLITGVPGTGAGPVDSLDRAELAQLTDHDGMTIARGRLSPSGGADALARPTGRPAAPRPPVARLELSTGETVDLTGPVFIGRAPSARHAALDAVPTLVPVTSPGRDISRTHLEVRLEDDSVVVTDVSANGTVLVRPGQAPTRLPERESVLVTAGCVLDLGDGVTIRVTRVGG